MASDAVRSLAVILLLLIHSLSSLFLVFNTGCSVLSSFAIISLKTRQQDVDSNGQRKAVYLSETEFVGVKQPYYIRIFICFVL